MCEEGGVEGGWAGCMGGRGRVCVVHGWEEQSGRVGWEVWVASGEGWWVRCETGGSRMREG